MSDFINVKDYMTLDKERPLYYFKRKGPNREAASVRATIVSEACDELVSKLHSTSADFREAPYDLLEAYEDLTIRMRAIVNYEKKIALEDK